MQVSSRSWKRQRSSFFHSLQKDHSPADTLVLARWGPFQMAHLQNYDNFALFKFTEFEVIFFSRNRTLMHSILSFFFFFLFLHLHLPQMKVPRLGIELKLQLPAYDTAIAMQDPSHICDLHHNSKQCWILNHWARPGIGPTSSWILVGFIASEPQQELPLLSCFELSKWWFFFKF